MDNRKEKEALMRRIQDLSFAKDETILFLDTHPECQMALSYLRDVTKNLDTATAEYQNKYGPIYHEAGLSDKWSWAFGMWPWQTERTDGGKK
jgi:spore coat protein JB